jgi:hypothetical protein
MSLIVQALDQMIAAAEAVDHRLHASLDYLRELRAKLTTFSGTADDEDALVGALRSLAAGS